MFAARKTDNVSSAANYIEDVFSTWLYTGTGAAQTITNGIDLSGKGGMVWAKTRSSVANPVISDTVKGPGYWISSASTVGWQTDAQGITAFNSNGFSVGSQTGFNASGSSMVSWTFREQAKFFDVVTYTGTGVARTVAHNLGSVPGCIIVKRTDTTGSWNMYHRSLANTQFLALNLTDAAATATSYWNSTTPTSTEFTLGAGTGVNASGGTYVAYLFAHDAGGFGASGTDNVITCGTYLGSNHRSKEIVTLGYEPQWVMVKNISSAGQRWVMVDNMRGMANTGSQAWLFANSNVVETTTAADQVVAASTGFFFNGPQSDINEAGSTFIYIAIRRGPMKTPTSGTSVFSPFASQGGGGTAATPSYQTNFPVDLAMVALKSGAASNTITMDRLRGSSPQLNTSATNAEAANSSWKFDSNIGFYIGLGANADRLGWMFRRAPGFMDVVCYTGDGVSGLTLTHNLQAVPELMIVKNRSASANWGVYSQTTGNTNFQLLNLTNATAVNSAYWNNTSPTSTTFTVGSGTVVNSAGGTFVAYLFASVNGVSKVGSYTGNGSSQTINCGFAAGARFILIKRTSSTGDWYVWDTARGIVSGNDPRLSLNTTAAEVTTDDSIDPDNSGFIVNQLAATNINVNAATYIYLAIA